MSEKKMDISKVLAILAQPKEEPKPLENVERLRLEIKYITKEEKVDTRAIRIIWSKGALKPMPLIYVPHYEMGEDALELRDYLAKGWAVACPSEFNDSYNGTITDDDLVFNNAALYTLRNRPEFDPHRIILVGGSAGGYMTMMLNGLQLGLCASIANGPITNIYFNLQYYFPKANALNLKALAEIAAKKAAEADHTEKQTENYSTKGSEEDEKNAAALALLQSLQSLPIPFLAALTGIFKPNEDNYTEDNDYTRWEELTAVGIADRFCSPIMVNHCTSDVLVPVDQISRRYTYDKPGESLPAEYDGRLPHDLPGKLKYSLEECLPEQETLTTRIIVPEDASAETVLPFDETKQFNLHIFDDGPVEGYGTHSARMDVGRRLDTPYLEEMFARTSCNTCKLTPGMLKSLLLRYQGRSIALPAHIGVDDQAYGSLAMYQKEVCEELGDWMSAHGAEALQAVCDIVLERTQDSSERELLASTMKEIMNVYTH